MFQEETLQEGWDDEDRSNKKHHQSQSLNYQPDDLQASLYSFAL
jgi:hypothetical protein